MLANMAASLIKHERIQTTDSKARALRPFVERLVTFGKKGDLHSRRVVLSRLRDKDATHKLFEAIGPRFAERPGGYTRILKIGRRDGDAATISLIEFVDAAEARIEQLAPTLTSADVDSDESADDDA